MSKQIPQILKLIPKAIKTTAKNELNGQMNLMPMKIQNHLEQKIKGGLVSVKNEFENIPNEFKDEYRRQSYHQGTQPFDSNRYFENYYEAQRRRYNATPQPNLAEIIYTKEKQSRKY